MPSDACKFITRPIMNSPAHKLSAPISPDVFPRDRCSSRATTNRVCNPANYLMPIIIYAYTRVWHASSRDKIQLRSVTRIVPRNDTSHEREQNGRRERRTGRTIESPSLGIIEGVDRIEAVIALIPPPRIKRRIIPDRS